MILKSEVNKNTIIIYDDENYVNKRYLGRECPLLEFQIHGNAKENHIIANEIIKVLNKIYNLGKDDKMSEFRKVFGIEKFIHEEVGYIADSIIDAKMSEGKL